MDRSRAEDRLRDRHPPSLTAHRAGDLAWDYLKSRPDWRKLVKAPEYHASAVLLDGLEENYRGLGVDWPANRYLLIAMSGDADVRGHKPMQTGVVNGWRCRYDLQTGKFDVPAVFHATMRRPSCLRHRVLERRKPPTSWSSEALLCNRDGPARRGTPEQPC